MQMFDSSQILLPAEELKKRFEEEGKLKFILLTHILQNSFFFPKRSPFSFFADISMDSPIMASCGTGVTACILALVTFLYACL